LGGTGASGTILTLGTKDQFQRGRKKVSGKSRAWGRNRAGSLKIKMERDEHLLK